MESQFATLEPVNVLAKIAFSEVYDAILRGPQALNDTRPKCRMVVEPHKTYSKDVLQFQREMDKLGDDSESSTDLDSDSEKHYNQRGRLWKGHYTLHLDSPPSQPDIGWVLGKGPGEKKPHADILLSTRAFAKQQNIRLRSLHARFNFALQNRALFATSISTPSLAGFAINGVHVGREMYALNQHVMNIRLGPLEYRFRYSTFASSESFVNRRQEYMTTKLRAPTSIDFDMPTPRLHTRTIGQWTLGHPLGRGALGRVFLGSNSRNEMVAVKMMEFTSQSKPTVDAEIAVCQALTALAKKDDAGDRIVQLREVIDSRQELSTPQRSFDEIGLILEPMTPSTLRKLVREPSVGGHRGMPIETARIFHDALLGLDFLHHNNWVHRDIKPDNIGVISGRAVLLDVGQAESLILGSTLRTLPGSCGTINYLAPELEMTEYNHSADVWSMGCIGFQLTYGYHPFRFRANPWRPGAEYEALRPDFHQKYCQAIDKILSDYERFASIKAADRDPRFIHLGIILVQMLRHPFAEAASSRESRISVQEALSHEVWTPLFSEHRQCKRARVKA